MKKKKVVVYVREYRRKFEPSVEHQVDLCKDFCKSNGLEIQQVIRDFGDYYYDSTNEYLDLPTFIRMLNRTLTNKCSGLVLFSLDRLGTNTAEIVNSFDELYENEIEIFSVNERFYKDNNIRMIVRELIIRLNNLSKK